MGLILSIENAESLPDGVPAHVRLEREGGLDIGRGATQDWSLPDPSRFISSKHCEIRYRDESYWLYDISSNGTFLGGSTSRLQGPHRLRDGERFAVGPYSIAVTIEPDEEIAEATNDIPTPVLVIFPTLTEEKIAEAKEPQASEILPAKPFWDENPSRGQDAHVGDPLEHDLHVAEPAPSPARDAGSDEFLRRFAAAAGVPEQIFAQRDGLQLAEELGTLLRTIVENLTQLLRARAEVGRTAGVSAQTMVQAVDNNPLKFSPSTEDALRIMFGPRTKGFLDARHAVESAFADLEAHQLYTFSAMQQAIRMLVEDFDPKAIDAAAGPAQGFSNLFGSRKARLWDLYVARWQAKCLRHDDGLAGAFLRYFGQCFDDAKDSKIPPPRH
jgi:type VI secretion system protein ImpI